MRIALFLILAFFIGFLSCYFILNLNDFKIEKPLNINGFASNNPESPSDWIKREQITLYEDKIVIKLKNAGLSDYAPTGSMRPILDENATGIKIKPESEEQINIGDIVTFQSGEDLIVHRIIKKGKDENGTYFITKGDNNDFSDEKIRFSDIRYVTIGIIW